MHSGYTFFCPYVCVPWELNPQSFALLTQCSTTEPQEHTYPYWYLGFIRFTRPNPIAICTFGKHVFGCKINATDKKWRQKAKADRRIDPYIDPYNVFLDIATNIPQRLKTVFVVHGHKSVPLKKQMNPQLGWPESEFMFILGEVELHILHKTALLHFV